MRYLSSAGRASVIAVAAAVCWGTASGAAAATSPRPAPPSSSASGSAAAAGAEARLAAARVEQLATEYRRRQRVAAAAAAELAATFAVSSTAEAEHDRAQALVRRARAQQAARVRALYADGEDWSAFGVLAAPTPMEAMWRATVGRRVSETVLRTAATDLRRTEEAALAAGQSAAGAEDAGARLATSLGRLREESTSSQLVLLEARRRLAALSATARRLKEVERAAAALAAAQAAASATQLPHAGPVGALGIPAGFEQAYRSASGSCPGLRWTLLAALGQVESGHGRNNGPSSSGAIGPMQFMPATFAAYGVDGDRDGRKDAWSYADAVPSAANYLCVSGLDTTAAGVRKALFAYNHAQWYVDLVLGTERAITAAQAAPED